MTKLQQAMGEGNIWYQPALAYIKHDRADLQPRTVYFDSKTIALAAIPAGGLVVCPAEDVWQQEHVKQGELQLLNVIHEPDGKPTFVVLARR